MSHHFDGIVLIGCERSQTVCTAFRERGVEAYSCDIEPAYGNHPEWHIQGDLREVYDMVRPALFIAHPPCTYLSNAGMGCMRRVGGEIDKERFAKMLDAKKFFLWCLSRPSQFVAVENPTPLTMAQLPKPTQQINPWQFGEPYRKRTLLWLKNLEPLHPTRIVKPKGSWTEMHKSAKVRSKTFEGIAAAMEDQWPQVPAQYEMGVI
jgi:hypothetical protein